MEGQVLVQCLQEQWCFVCGMIVVDLKLSGSKGRCTRQSPGKGKSSRQHRSKMVADAGQQLATSATCLYTEEERKRVSLTPALLSAIHSQGSLSGSQMDPGLSPRERLPKSSGSVIVPCFTNKLGSMWAWLHSKMSRFSLGFDSISFCRTSLCLSPLKYLKSVSLLVHVFLLPGASDTPELQTDLPGKLKSWAEKRQSGRPSQAPHPSTWIPDQEGSAGGHSCASLL